MDIATATVTVSTDDAVAWHAWARAMDRLAETSMLTEWVANLAVDVTDAEALQNDLAISLLEALLDPHYSRCADIQPTPLLVAAGGVALYGFDRLFCQYVPEQKLLVLGLSTFRHPHNNLHLVMGRYDEQDAIDTDLAFLGINLGGLGPAPSPARLVMPLGADAIASSIRPDELSTHNKQQILAALTAPQ